MSKTPELTSKVKTTAAQEPVAEQAAPAAAASITNAVSFARRDGIDSTNVDYDTPHQDIDHNRVRDTGIALSDVRGIENDVHTSLAKAALENEKFMAERIEIQLADPGDENEHQFAEITVNGERVCIRRGDSATIKRSHLAVLAQAKVQRVVQTKVTAPDGSMGYEEKFVLRPVYPFQVMHDPSGKVGNTWLRTLLQNS